MDKIEPGSHLATSGDVVSENVEKLRALFPEAFGEGGIRFDVLQQLLGGALDDREERFGLSWHGKRQARQLALTPSLGTLRPCPEESVDWDKTKNLVIEGDNLEVLKLLRKSYAGKIKLIYIDPPYNTGNDFVYPDDFKDGVGNYLRVTGQVGEDGGKITSNTESSGRFHTNWLNMMYPRLKLAKELLTPDGAIFISMDDRELATLRLALDEIFGAENFEAAFTWQTKQAARGVPPVNLLIQNHEYILCYSRAGGLVFRGDDRSDDDFKNPDGDPRGPWRSESMKATGKQDNWFDIVEPETGRRFHGNWAFAQATVARMVAERLVLFPERDDGVPRQKKFKNTYINETKAIVTNLGWHSTERATAAFIERFDGKKVFDFPKPVGLISYMVRQASKPGDIVLDFFAGSGTTAEAVLAENELDDGKRRFIMVQIPQRTQLAEYPTISAITCERIRRTAIELCQASALAPRPRDRGFRVFKLDSSNIKAWEPRPEDIDNAITDWIENIRPGRTEQDLLYELLLKLGLDLCVAIETREMAGKQVHNIGAGTLLVCLDRSITRADIEPLGQGLVEWVRELSPAGGAQLVFRDSAFTDDVAKTNLEAILRQNLPDKALAAIRSL